MFSSDPVPLRGAVSLVVLTLMFGGPCWVQLLGGTPGPWTRPWRMYKFAGREVCTVAYQDAKGAPLDRYAMLKVQNPEPRRLLLHTVLDVHEEANRLCKAHPDLRVTANCTTDGPFETVITPEQPLCR